MAELVFDGTKPVDFSFHLTEHHVETQKLPFYCVITSEAKYYSKLIWRLQISDEIYNFRKEILSRPPAVS